MTQFLPEGLKPIVPSNPDQMNEGIHEDDQAQYLGCTYLLEHWNSTAAFLELLKNGPKEPFDMENNHSADYMWIHLVLLLGMHCYTGASSMHCTCPKRHSEFQQVQSSSSLNTRIQKVAWSESYCQQWMEVDVNHLLECEVDRTSLQK